MLHIIVAQQKIHQPGNRFVLILGLMKVVEGFVHLLYRTKWPLDLTLRARRRASAIFALWQMSAYVNIQVAHDLLNTWLLATGPLSKQIIFGIP